MGLSAQNQNAGSVKSSEDGSTDEQQFTPAEKSYLQKIIRKGLVESTKDLEIQRKDPTSPLYSVKTFEALHLLVFVFSIFINFRGKILFYNNK